MKVCVVGLGYIGLPTALSMAANGVEVVGVDYDKSLIATLKKGETTFVEKGLDDLLGNAIKEGIVFSSSYVTADVYIVAVPTPYEKTSKKIDASFVNKAVSSIIDVCPKGAIIVIESTVSPNTIDNQIRPVMIEKGIEINKDIYLVHAPERILPGNMLYELCNNSRTIGADLLEIGEKIKKLYQAFCIGDIVVTDIKTAEMTKVVENTYRDINIAFANELTKICHEADLDVYKIIKIANKHPRVNILQPGPGVGGHCISVDPWFLVGDYPGLANIILCARNINDSMPEFVIKRIHDIMVEKKIKSVERVGLYGLTYKENVDDIRESPTLQLIECMENHLASGIKVYDPFVKEILVDNQYNNFDKFLSDVDLVVIMIGHSEIIDEMDKLKSKVVLDTRNVCNFDSTYRL